MSKFIFFPVLFGVGGYGALRKGLFGQKEYEWPVHVPSNAHTKVQEGIFTTTVQHSWYDEKEEARLKAADPQPPWLWDDLPLCPWFRLVESTHIFPIRLPLVPPTERFQN